MMNSVSEFERVTAAVTRSPSWRFESPDPCNAVSGNATVHIVDDDEQMRRSLGWLLEAVGVQARSHASAREFLVEFDDRLPGCVVTDVRMAGMGGLELQQELLRRGAGIPIIFITAHADVAMCVSAMKRGAYEFLEKPFNQQTLVDRIQGAIKFDQERHARRVRADVVAARLSLLSQREKEVLDMIFAGASNRAIAAALRITVRTVEAHRARVMEKMRADSVVTLVRMVCQAGA